MACRCLVLIIFPWVSSSNATKPCTGSGCADPLQEDDVSLLGQITRRPKSVESANGVGDDQRPRHPNLSEAAQNAGDGQRPWSPNNLKSANGDGDDKRPLHSTEINSGRSNIGEQRAWFQKSLKPAQGVGPKSHKSGPYGDNNDDHEHEIFQFYYYNVYNTAVLNSADSYERGATLPVPPGTTYATLFHGLNSTEVAMNYYDLDTFLDDNVKGSTKWLFNIGGDGPVTGAITCSVIHDLLHAIEDGKLKNYSGVLWDTSIVDFRDCRRPGYPSNGYNKLGDAFQTIANSKLFLGGKPPINMVTMPHTAPFLSCTQKTVGDLYGADGYVHSTDDVCASSIVRDYYQECIWEASKYCTWNWPWTTNRMIGQSAFVAALLKDEHVHIVSPRLFDAGNEEALRFACTEKPDCDPEEPHVANWQLFGHFLGSPKLVPSVPDNRVTKGAHWSVGELDRLIQGHQCDWIDPSDEVNHAACDQFQCSGLPAKIKGIAAFMPGNE